MNITGNKKDLFSQHGIVDTDKALRALKNLSGIDDFDINKLNDTSKLGGLYVKSNGEILNTFTKTDEADANYKIVPTGLKFRFTEYPLFASFIKIKNVWEGCFIGTGVTIFKLYEQHYNETFNTMYMNVFSGENRINDIRGFGLNEVAYNIEHGVCEEITVTNTNSEISQQIEKALNKIKEKESKSENNKNKKVKHKSKAQRKAEMLKNHLEKVRIKEEKQRKLDEEKAKQEELQLRIDNGEVELYENIIWINVKAIEDTHVNFEDDNTKQLSKKIEEYINCDKLENEFEPLEEIEMHEEYCHNAKDNNIKNISSEIDVLHELNHDTIVLGESAEYEVYIKNDILEDLYERLLIKEKWKRNNKSKLGFYLKALCFFIWREQKECDSTHGNGYTFSLDKKYCVINTGLMDKYGNYIYILDHTPSIPNFYDKVISIVNNKADLINFKFKINDAKYLPSPVQFFKDKRELIFDAEYDDFDLDDTAHLYHIIQERIGRFPKKYQRETPLNLCEKLKSSIRQAIMISKTDYKYIVPKYDFERQKIQFLIPLYLDNNLDESPELVLVIGKQDNGIWNIFTVLNSEDAYDDARLISRVNDTWLNNNKKGENKNEKHTNKR